MKTADDLRGIAFAELVRKQASVIVRLAMAGRTQDIEAEAFALMQQAIARKRELQGLPIHDDNNTGQDGTDALDLRTFNQQFGDGDTPPATG